MRRSIGLWLCALSLSACADLDVGKNAYKQGDYRAAEKNLEVLAYQYNLPQAKFDLARTYRRQGAPEIYGPKIVTLLEDAKQFDQGAAAYELARVYEDGYGVPVNLAAAEANYAISYGKGYERAKSGLLNVTAERAAAAGDYKTAIRSWSELVSSGDRNANIKLAMLYESLTERGQYDRQIIDLLKKAGDAQGGRAYFELGRIYDQGNLYIVFANGEKAAHYYMQAAEAGYWRADYYRAKLYERGEIVPENRPAAIELYKRVWEQHQYDRALEALQKMGAV